jgi:hypothetical protein
VKYQDCDRHNLTWFTLSADLTAVKGPPNVLGLSVFGVEMGFRGTSLDRDENASPTPVVDAINGLANQIQFSLWRWPTLDHTNWTTIQRSFCQPTVIDLCWVSGKVQVYQAEKGYALRDHIWRSNRKCEADDHVVGTAVIASVGANTSIAVREKPKNASQSEKRSDTQPPL